MNKTPLVGAVMSETEDEPKRPFYYMQPLKGMRLSDKFPEAFRRRISVRAQKPSEKTVIRRKIMDCAERDAQISLPTKTFYQQMRSRQKSFSFGNATEIQDKGQFKTALSYETACKQSCDSKSSQNGPIARRTIRSREVKIPVSARERKLISDHFDRLTVPTIGKNYDELESLVARGFRAERTQTVVESMGDFICKRILLVEALVAFATAKNAHQRAPTNETAFLVARIERYFSLVVRMLRRATARLELAYENPRMTMKPLFVRTYLLPKSIRNSEILRDDHS